MGAGVWRRLFGVLDVAGLVGGELGVLAEEFLGFGEAARRELGRVRL